MQGSTNRPVIYWLLTGCFLIFIMVLVGGITRLTNSGLSMVEWNLLMGSIPPLNDAEWQIAFEKYKQFPEYQMVNYHFTLEEFKPIFFWEYLHRVLGRLVGIVFIIPFLYFLVRKMISKELLPKLLLLLLMGGFQGFLGWYMVKSGLNKDPDVSHFRLAMHLTTAFLTFSYTLWVALDLMYPNKVKGAFKTIKTGAVVLLLVTVIQIVWGAFVAGLNAGKVYNTWPLMGDQLVADAVTAMSPLWINFVEGLAGVQFIHRYMAYAVVGLVVFLAIQAKKHMISTSQKGGIRFLIGMVSIQFVLGIVTLLLGVPVWLGVLHQVCALLLLGTVVFVLHRFSYSSGKAA